MNFKQRLFKFSIGFGIGLLFVSFFFGDRFKRLNWTPNNRVISQVIDNPIAINPDVLCLMKCHQIDSINLVTSINDGDVMFKESEVSELPKMYVIEANHHQQVFKAYFTILQDKSDLNTIVFLTKNQCDC